MADLGEKTRPVENDLAFQAEQFAKAKMRAQEVGAQQRQAFGDIQRMSALMAIGGVTLPNQCITFEDPVDQAAWESYTGDRGQLPNDPPMPLTETEIEVRALALLEGGGRR
jgi:hypothetical protein